jgi:hypothetical protein
VICPRKKLFGWIHRCKPRGDDYEIFGVSLTGCATSTDSARRGLDYKITMTSNNWSRITSQDQGLLATQLLQLTTVKQSYVTTADRLCCVCRRINRPQAIASGPVNVADLWLHPNTET